MPGNVPDFPFEVPLGCRGIIQLFKKSFKLYLADFPTLSLLILPPLIFSLITLSLLFHLRFTTLQYSVLFSASKFITYILIALLFVISLIATINHLIENSGFKDSWRKGWKLILPAIWLLILLFVITSGGILLFILPGIIFLNRYWLSLFTLVAEGKRGIGALTESDNLVRGKFFPVLIRLILLLIIIYIIEWLVPFLVSLSIINERLLSYIKIVTAISLAFFTLPFSLVCSYLIYRNLLPLKVTAPYRRIERFERAISGKFLLPLAVLLGGVFTGLLLTSFTLNHFLGVDIPPPADEELCHKKVNIPRNLNAFYDLENSFIRLVNEYPPQYFPPALPKFVREGEVYRAMLEGEMWGFIAGKDWLKANEEALMYLAKALEKPYYQDMRIANPEEIEQVNQTFPDGYPYAVDLAKWCIIKGNWLLLQKRKKEAMEWYLRALRFGDLLEEHSPIPKNYMQYFTAIDVKVEALRLIRKALSRVNVSSNYLKDFSREILRYKGGYEGFKRVVKSDYMLEKSDNDIWVREEIRSMYWGSWGILPLTTLVANFLISLNKFNFLPNLYLEEVAKNFLYIERDIGKTYEDLILPSEVSDKIWDAYDLPNWGRFFLRNGLGEFYIKDIICPNIRKSVQRKYLANFDFDATAVWLAIKAYEMEKGKLPDSLKELVPMYLPEVPKDPFDGKPIRYSKEKKIIYSVGPDLIDSGGSKVIEYSQLTTEEMRAFYTMSDPTIEIEPSY
jgi:hypothetical protein